MGRNIENKMLSDAELKAIIKKQEKNTMVAHYTTMEGLYGILNGIEAIKGEYTLNMWASNIFSLNDPEELLYGYSVLRKWLPKIEAELNVDNQEKLSRIWSIAKVAKKYSHYNKLLLESLQCQDNIPYIISFSRVIDNLAMFRLYGNDASGVCLVFSYGAIKGVCSLYDVCYNEELDSNKYSPYDMLRTDYGLYLANIKNKEMDANEKFQLMLQHLVSYILITAPYLKKGDYEFEKEIRYSELCQLTNEIKFRTSKNGNIIPYKETKIPFIAINRIIIGPCACFNSAKKSIELILKSKGIINIPPIVESKNKYRNY
ncbi:MAG: DUF2971 domain-containing protein [Bacteroidaceae bacterium]|nr:DUF2971 domain-containing protein [Bacteroidaceae bacterium]